MKKIFSILLVLLLSASIAQADTFTVSAWNNDFVGSETNVNTKALDYSVNTNDVETVAIGANISVEAINEVGTSHVYTLDAYNSDGVFSETNLWSELGAVHSNDLLSTLAIGANISLEAIDYGDSSHTFDLDAENDYVVSAETNVWADSGVHDNMIETVSIGANISVDAITYGDTNNSYNIDAFSNDSVSSDTNLWSDNGSAYGNTISTLAIGANVSIVHVSGFGLE